MTRYPLVPWGYLAPSDLDRSGAGLWTRDTRGAISERQLALRVTGSIDPGLTLGLIALRCERVFGGLVPVSLAIVDSVVLEDVSR